MVVSDSTSIDICWTEHPPLARTSQQTQNICRCEIAIFSKLCAGFDWSGDTQETGTNPKKRELESEEESTDSEAEASTQVRIRSVQKV